MNGILNLVKDIIKANIENCTAFKMKSLNEEEEKLVAPYLDKIIKELDEYENFIS